MREAGLDQAIRAAGGVSALARKIGISQPSVSNWRRVPAERVISVEHVTGIDRAALRPDLYGMAEAATNVERVEHEFFNSGLAGGRFAAPGGSDRELLVNHLAAWLGRFFADLEQATVADFYHRVGALGRLFVEVEREASRVEGAGATDLGRAL